MKKLMILGMLVFLLSGCGVSPDVGTAKEFIPNYSAAFAAGDIETVMKMWSFSSPIDLLKMDPSLKAGIKEQRAEEMKAELESSMKNKDLWYKAWKNTKYVSEKDCGSFIIVKVKVPPSYSDVVLIKENGFLRMHPNPSFFMTFMPKKTPSVSSRDEFGMNN